MKYLKYFESLNQNTTYYLSSSSVKRSELPLDIKSVLHLKLASNLGRTYDTSKDVNCDIRNYKFEIIKQFDCENLQYENLYNNDLVIFHGGHLYDIVNNIKKYNLQNKILDCIKSSKYYLGISSGTVLLSKNSFLTKESTEIMYNHIHEDIAGIGIFDFGLNCHVDMLEKDEYFIENFNKSLPLFKDDFYMIYDGSYIKIMDNKVQIFGNVLTKENANFQIINNKNWFKSKFKKYFKSKFKKYNHHS